jgi:methionine-rich copper-binding protein CopC
MKRFIAALFTATLALIAFAAIASAHAQLDHCTPAVGSTNATAPTEVRCWFTDELDPKQSIMSVTDSNNARVDNNDAKVDLNDKEHKQMVATVKSLPQGVYKVAWHAVTPDDNGVTEGSWYFGVGQVTVPQTTDATPAASSPATPTPSPNTLPDPTRTYITAGLVIAAAVGIGYLARMVIK